ncbi:winged helix-turn-helix transcriptional regulator [Nocardioides sp. GY 10113]|nr:winged helix-turn-helix transcriptional regulator [Nocardioides sp. GY 10113]
MIGDVIDSRSAVDRTALHRRVAAALETANGRYAPLAPLRITVGDEYQGRFASVGDALRASLDLRLALLPDHDVRHGVGWGEVEVLAANPPVEDGPGWWAAREAIHEVQVAEDQPTSRTRRTAYVDAGGGPAAGPVNAALLLRDHLVGALDARGATILQGMLDGTSQRELAETLGITPSAVSQRIRADGLAALAAAERELGTA